MIFTHASKVHAKKSFLAFWIFVCKSLRYLWDPFIIPRWVFAWRRKVKSRDTPPHYFATVWPCFLVNHRNITLFGGGSNNSCSLSRGWSAVDRHYLWKTSIIDVLGYIIHHVILFESCTISTKVAWLDFSYDHFVQKQARCQPWLKKFSEFICPRSIKKRDKEHCLVMQ